MSGFKEEYTSPAVEEELLPAGWVRSYDEHYKEYYYYHEETNLSQWEFPGAGYTEYTHSDHGHEAGESDNPAIFDDKDHAHTSAQAPAPASLSEGCSLYSNPYPTPLEDDNEAADVVSTDYTHYEVPGAAAGNTSAPAPVLGESEDDDDCDISRRPEANIVSLLRTPVVTDTPSEHLMTTSVGEEKELAEDVDSSGVGDEYSDMDDSGGSDYSDVDNDCQYYQHHQDPQSREEGPEEGAEEGAEDRDVALAPTQERVPPLQLRRPDDQPPSTQCNINTGTAGDYGLDNHPPQPPTSGPGGGASGGIPGIPGIPASELDISGDEGSIRMVEGQGPGGAYFEGRTHDYPAIAKIYKVIRKYGHPTAVCECILCHNGTCHNVFFPCQHRCVCNACMTNECIVDDTTFLKNNHLLATHSPDDLDSGSGHCNCPLCGEIIKKILPHEFGKEVDVYWDWVLETRPALPFGFMKKFNHSAGVIQAVYVNPEFVRVPEAGSLAAATVGLGQIPTSLGGVSSLINRELIRITTVEDTTPSAEERAAEKLLLALNRDSTHHPRSSSSTSNSTSNSNSAARRKKRLHKRRTNEFMESLKLKEDQYEELEVGSAGMRTGSNRGDKEECIVS